MKNRALYERIKNLQIAIDLEIALVLKENELDIHEAKALADFLATMAQSNIDNANKVAKKFLK